MSTNTINRLKKIVQEPEQIDDAAMTLVLSDFFEYYDEHLEAAAAKLNLTGKTIEAANKEQALYYRFYEDKRQEVKAVLGFVEAWVACVRGRLYEKYMTNHNASFKDREVNQFINHKREYLDVYEVLLAVQELADKYNAVVEAFKMRGYALRNITDLRINQLQFDVL